MNDKEYREGVRRAYRVGALEALLRRAGVEVPSDNETNARTDAAFGWTGQGEGVVEQP